MTTIVVDVQNAKVYSDTLTTSRFTESTKSGFIGKDNIINKWAVQSKGEYSKVFEHDSYIIAGAGCMDTLKCFNEQYPESFPKPPTSDTTIMVLMKRHKSISVMSYETVETKRSLIDFLFNRPIKYKWNKTSTVVDHDWIVFGSGAMFAQGALKSDVHPIEAIKIASSLDSSTGDDVVCFDIP